MPPPPVGKPPAASRQCAVKSDVKAITEYNKCGGIAHPALALPFEPKLGPDTLSKTVQTVHSYRPCTVCTV